MHYTQLSRRGGCWSSYRDTHESPPRPRTGHAAQRVPCRLPPSRPAYTKLRPFLLLLILAVLLNLVLPAD
ncbi:hypothetical protein [Paludibacterium yongneupense]|uniref:hypothetical protein n=1 Tax=Paludibacterium yongneupense TaxID=400061 RepID=UPI000420EEA4|nr:hypothetical protein [Paludibacterium yongneupense]